MSFSNNLKRPLINQSPQNILQSTNMHHSNSTTTRIKDLVFSPMEKENIPNTSSNLAYKSLTFSGSPTLSRKSSFKRHLRKRSSSIFHSGGNHHHHHSRNSSTGTLNWRNHKHTQSNPVNNLTSLKNKKSNSSIDKSIFHFLSSKASIDSLLNFNNDSSSMAKTNKQSKDHLKTPLFLHTNTNILEPQSSRSELDSYYSTDDDLDENADAVNLSTILCNFDDEDHNEDDMYAEHNEDMGEDGDTANLDLDFGSPLQRRKKNKSIIQQSRNNQLKLQRHQSLTQFSPNNNSLSYKFDTDQLTSNINGLSVNSDDDDFNLNGNSVLNDVPFQYFYAGNNKIPRINVDEFKKILTEYESRFNNTDKKFCKHFDDLMIVDCRFKFEFDGGHIKGAINISSFEEMENVFFNDFVLNKSPIELNNKSRKLLIFHCEFSSHRGPIKADQLRYFDRSISGDFYPNLYYPNVLVLEGGYKDYYESERKLHKTLSYIEMDHPLYKDERDRNMNLLRRENSLSRVNSRSSSCLSLSRKNSHSSIKSMNSSNLLDFSSVNKIDNTGNTSQPLKNRLNKKFYGHKIDTSLNDPGSLDLVTPTDDGIFGGFGNQDVDLDSLIDFPDEFDENDQIDSVDSQFINNSNGNNNMTANSNNHNSSNKIDGFKIPLPKPYVNRRNTLHSRSKTVSTFSFHNNSGFRSAPLLSTPERVEAKFGDSLFKHNDSSVYSVKESNEESDENDSGYVSIYSQKYTAKHNIDTPMPKRKY